MNASTQCHYKRSNNSNNLVPYWSYQISKTLPNKFRATFYKERVRNIHKRKYQSIYEFEKYSNEVSIAREHQIECIEYCNNENNKHQEVEIKLHFSICSSTLSECFNHVRIKSH